MAVRIKDGFAKRAFTRDELLEKLDAPVLDKIIGHRRWSVDHRLVFEHEGKLYETTYSVGATEQQDEGPWEHERGPIECVEVVARQRLVTDYEAVRVHDGLSGESDGGAKGADR